MTGVTVLPVPGAVTPSPGVGVTYYSWMGVVPGTILRAGPEVFWFEVDTDFEGAEKLTPAFREWTNRAILYDGVWRVGHEMLRVEVGVRRTHGRSYEGASEADLLAGTVDAIEPALVKRRWYPMSSMAIPSVMKRADDLLARIAAYSGPERERVAALHERLTKLRKGFRNIGGGLTNWRNG